jgi:hypothetical protein
MVIPTAQQRTIAAAAVVLWLAVTVVLLTAHWSLSCTVDGQSAGGIDCLGKNGMPDAGSAPASWFGFVPLVLLWVAATAALAWCAVAARRRRR